MIIQDQFGCFHDIPEQRLGDSRNLGYGDMLYDGLGNPLGFPLLSLLPLAAQILPSLLPAPTPSGSPSSRPAPTAPPPLSVALPLPPSVPPSTPSPSMSPPQIIVMREPAPGREAFVPALPAVPIGPRVVFRRRGSRRRHRPIRARVERFTEQVSVPPSALPEPVSIATDANGRMSGWYSAPYSSNYYSY
jgi:hypothetical protein